MLFEADTNMTQDERWLVQWKAVMDFMEANKRRPSKFERTGGQVHVPVFHE